MRVSIKRVDASLPLPEYHTPGAVAFDVYAREKMDIPALTLARIPTNIIVKIPAGYMLLLKDRSSTAKKKGLFVTTGFIDQDYCGENDEIMLQVYNFTKETVTVERGERIGQAAFVPIEKAEWMEIKKMEGNNRGGFGSTGS